MPIPLRVANVCKSFGGQKVLDGISFEIGSGEIFGLIGLNGAGKTTLIKVILDLLRADSGEIFIADKKNTMPDSRRELRYLPEKFQPSPLLKGREFFDIFNPDAQQDETAKLCNILSFDKSVLDVRISKYSKGMVQKIGLISTFLGNSQIIVLDEPMSGLDPLAHAALKTLLLDSKTKGKSIFFSSHILTDIDEICDRIAILHNAKLIFTGTTSNLKHQNESLEEAFLRKVLSEKNDNA